MKKILLLAITALTLVSTCGDLKPKILTNKPSCTETSAGRLEVSDQNTSFEEFKESFLTDMWALNPSAAIYVGYYKHDSQLEIPNKERDQKQAEFNQRILNKAALYHRACLSRNNEVDLALIKNYIKASIWYRQTFKGHEWNPSVYNVAGPLGLILNTDYKSLEDRLRAINARLTRVADYYQAAKLNITVPTLEHTDLAIQQNSGALSLLTQSLPKAVAGSSLSVEEKKHLEINTASAIAAIENYIAWLSEKRDLIAQKGARDFRIGKTLYEEKFRQEITSSHKAKDLYERAKKEKSKIHYEMIIITDALWPKYFPGQLMPREPLLAVKTLINHLSAKHVQREHFVTEMKQQISQLETFIIEKDLIDVDQSKPLIVRATPQYQRGVSVASINAPGPYDANATTYYNVMPMENLDEAKAESYLREYNHWIMQVLNIHEALPGHYTQLIHANKSPSKIKSIFRNGAMVEGWAVYAEKMMLEEGWGEQEPELWLMHHKMHLRVVTNTILDYETHVLGMTREEALELMIGEAFQERAEAEGKWRRATLSQVQLTSYYNGFSEIYAFREELKQHLGDQFSLKDFHNQFLSYGSIPVSTIRELMLEDLGALE